MSVREENVAVTTGAPAVPSHPPLRFPLITENSFRVLGVPSSASRRELLDADAAFRRTLKLGVARTTGWDLPWLGNMERTEATLQNAAGRLAEPEKRLIDRMFWFGPDAKELVNFDSEVRLNASSSQESSELDHDMALLMLAQAASKDPLFLDLPRWQAAIVAWIRVTSSDDYWTSLIKQDDAGDFEPPANNTDLSAVRHRANELAFSVVAEAARAQVASGNEAVVSRIITLIRGAPLQNDLRYGLENEILGPIEGSIIDLCREICTGCRSKIEHENDAAKKNKQVCAIATPRLDAELLPRLTRLENIGGKDSPFARRSRGEVALAYAEIAACWTWADDFVKSEELYKRAYIFAAGTPAEGRIKESVEKVKNPAHRQRDNFKPIKRPPALHTVNGIGTHLYSLGIAYPPNPEWQYATLYFVVLFIPIIPLKRYLVRSAGGNSWYFYATIRFGAVQWIHLGILGFILLASLLSPH
jgi:hypothetical protein